MYVAKACANLTTYSRKPENYTGTIIFEIDIMKNSSPINLNLGQTWLFHICLGCFFCFDLLWRWAESPVSPAEKKCYFGFDMAKIVNFKLSGDEFFMISISKIMVPLQSPGFLQYVVEFAIVLTTFMKRLPLPSQQSFQKLKNTGAVVIPLFSTICGWVRNSFEIRQSKINSRWVAGPIGQTNRRPSVWCSRYYFFHKILQIFLQKPFSLFLITNYKNENK